MRTLASADGSLSRLWERVGVRCNGKSLTQRKRTIGRCRCHFVEIRRHLTRPIRMREGGERRMLQVRTRIPKCGSLLPLCGRGLGVRVQLKVVDASSVIIVGRGHLLGGWACTPPRPSPAWGEGQSARSCRSESARSPPAPRPRSGEGRGDGAGRSPLRARQTNLYGARPPPFRER